MSTAHWRRGFAALVLALSVLVSGCTGSEEPPRKDVAKDRFPPPSSGPSNGPTGKVTNHPLGLKWNWQQGETLSFAEQTRGGATFYETEWCEIERQPGTRVWDKVDGIVKRAQDMGYVMLLKIRVGQCWVNEGGASARGGATDKTENVKKTPSSLPDDLAVYEEFVKAYVERYAAQGVHLYAIENEVDTGNFWRGSFTDYETLVRSGSKAVRAADAKAQVLDAGLSSTAYGAAMAADLLEQGRDDEALQLYRDIYARRLEAGVSRFPAADDTASLRRAVDSQAGRRAQEAFDATFTLARDGAFDVYQLHYYESWQTLPKVLDWIRENVPAELAIEAWEAGVAWPGVSYSPVEHADETVHLVATLISRGVNRIVYLPLAYTPESGRKHIFRGLVNPDGTLLPAGTAYQRLVEVSAGAGSAVPVEVDGLTGVAFDRGATTELVLWAGSDVRVDVQPPGGATAKTLRGAAADWSTSGLAVGTEPLFVTWPGKFEAVRAKLREATAVAS